MTARRHPPRPASARPAPPAGASCAPWPAPTSSSSSRPRTSGSRCGARRLFFLVIPFDPAAGHHQGRRRRAWSNRSARPSRCCPSRPRPQIKGDTPQGEASYALAGVPVRPRRRRGPLTISTAVGAATIVGERERGTGEFLAHSPAGVREIYLGKLIAILVPGYVTTIVGFGLYSLLVNTDRRPRGRRLVLPDRPVVGADAVGHPAVPRPHPVARAATVGSGEVDRGRAAGVGPREPPLILIAYSQSTGALFGGASVSWIIGGVAWVLAIVSLSRGMRSVSRARLLGVADEQ